MTRKRHPRWCDRKRCSVNRPTSPFNTHSSRQVGGRFDPDSGVSVELSLWRIRSRYTYLMVEFGNDCCQGHEISIRQAVELRDGVDTLLSELEPQDLDEEGPIDFAAIANQATPRRLSG